MGLWAFGIASAAVFALLNFYWLPRAQGSLAADRTLRSVPKAALVSLLTYLRTVGAVAALTVCGVGLLFARTDHQAGEAIQLNQPPSATVESLTLERVDGIRARLTPSQTDILSAINALDAWRTRLAVIERAWAVTVSILLVTAMAVFAYYRGRGQRKTAFSQRAREDQLGLARKFSLRPRPELEPEEESSTPSRWRDRILVLFVSRGLLGSMGTLSKVLFLAGYALLIPAFIGVSHAAISPELERRLAALEELQIKWSHLENRLRLEERVLVELERWEEAERQLEDDPSDLDLPDGWPEVSSRIARLYEEWVLYEEPAFRAYAQRPAAPGAAPALARDHILRRAATGSGSRLRIDGRSNDSWSELYAERLQAAAKPGRPATGEGRELEKDLARIAGQAPDRGVAAQWRRWLDSFQEPVRGDTLAKATVRNALDHLGRGFKLGSIVDPVDVAEAYVRYRRARAARFKADLAEGKPMRDAARRLRSDTLDGVLDTELQKELHGRLSRWLKNYDALFSAEHFSRTAQTSLVFAGEPHKLVVSTRTPGRAQSGAGRRFTTLEYPPTRGFRWGRFSTGVGALVLVGFALHELWGEQEPGALLLPPRQQRHVMPDAGDRFREVLEQLERGEWLTGGTVRMPGPEGDPAAMRLLREIERAATEAAAPPRTPAIRIELGRRPEDGALDLMAPAVDLRWNFDVEGRIHLRLLAKEEASAPIVERRLMPASRDVVAAALVFAAAEGTRALTVAATPSSGWLPQPIRLHPALVDTQVGDDLIRLANLATEFAGQATDGAADEGAAVKISVEEIPYGVKPEDLVWMQGSPRPPILRLRVSPSSPAKRLREATHSGTVTAPHLGELEHMQNTANEATTRLLDRITRFVLLQRLFRLALNQDLGPGFPVEKLALLAEHLPTLAESSPDHPDIAD